ncbi:hypothetical protein DIPPA_57667, partial [Diplonema papillatum]
MNRSLLENVTQLEQYSSASPHGRECGTPGTPPTLREQQHQQRKVENALGGLMEALNIRCKRLAYSFQGPYGPQNSCSRPRAHSQPPRRASSCGKCCHDEHVLEQVPIVTTCNSIPYTLPNSLPPSPRSRPTSPAAVAMNLLRVSDTMQTPPRIVRSSRHGSRQRRRNRTMSTDCSLSNGRTPNTSSFLQNVNATSVASTLYQDVSQSRPSVTRGPGCVSWLSSPSRRGSPPASPSSRQSPTRRLAPPALQPPLFPLSTSPRLSPRRKPKPVEDTGPFRPYRLSLLQGDVERLAQNAERNRSPPRRSLASMGVDAQSSPARQRYTFARHGLPEGIPSEYLMASTPRLEPILRNTTAKCSTPAKREFAVPVTRLESTGALVAVELARDEDLSAEANILASCAAADPMPVFDPDIAFRPLFDEHTVFVASAKNKTQREQPPQPVEPDNISASTISAGDAHAFLDDPLPDALREFSNDGPPPPEVSSGDSLEAEEMSRTSEVCYDSNADPRVFGADKMQDLPHDDQEDTLEAVEMPHMSETSDVDKKYTLVAEEIPQMQDLPHD